MRHRARFLSPFFNRLIGEENPCRCNETDGNWLAVPIADHPLGSTQSVTKTDLRRLGTAWQSATLPQEPLRSRSLPRSRRQQDCLRFPFSIGWSLRWRKCNCHFLVKMTEFGAAPKCNRFVRGGTRTGTADGASPRSATDGIQVHVSSTGQECCLVQ